MNIKAPCHVVVDWPTEDGRREKFGATVVRQCRKRKRPYLIAFDDGDSPRWSKLKNVTTETGDGGEAPLFTLPRPEVVQNVGLSNDAISQHPAGWQCEEGDHFETPLTAYQDLAVLLDAVAARLSKTRATLKVSCLIQIYF